MSLETGRTATEQASHEFTVIKDLEDAKHATNNWSDKEAPEIYRTRFADAMLRIQAGDVKTITMTSEVDPAGVEIVRLKLPVRVPALRNFETTIQARVEGLAKTEPNVKDLLPPTEKELISMFGLLHADNTSLGMSEKHLGLTADQKRKRKEIRSTLQVLAVGAIPRILAGEFDDIGLEYNADSPTIRITLFEGRHPIPIRVNPQIRELLPSE